MNALLPVPIAESTAAPPPSSSDHNCATDQEFPVLLRRYRLGLALFVCAVIMIFVGLSSAYVVRKGIPTYEPGTGAYSTVWEGLDLPIRLLAINTLVLIAASIVMEIARRSGSEGSKQRAATWLALSLLVVFVAGQGAAWRVLRSGGHWMNSGARTAFFYVLTEMHAAHVVLGMLCLVWITISRRHGRSHRIGVDLSAWYMHSMAILWIYLLCFLMWA